MLTLSEYCPNSYQHLYTRKQSNWQARFNLTRGFIFTPHIDWRRWLSENGL